MKVKVLKSTTVLLWHCDNFLFQSSFQGEAVMLQWKLSNSSETLSFSCLSPPCVPALRHKSSLSDGAGCW